jgi:hypothetical protein
MGFDQPRVCDERELNIALTWLKAVVKNFAARIISPPHIDLGLQGVGESHRRRPVEGEGRHGRHDGGVKRLQTGSDTGDKPGGVPMVILLNVMGSAWKGSRAGSAE